MSDHYIGQIWVWTASFGETTVQSRLHEGTNYTRIIVQSRLHEEKKVILG